MKGKSCLTNLVESFDKVSNIVDRQGLRHIVCVDECCSSAQEIIKEKEYVGLEITLCLATGWEIRSRKYG